MSQHEVTDYTELAGSVSSKRTLLQKTYLLLAASFLPCAAGVAVSAIFNPLASLFTGGWMGIIIFFAAFYGMCFLIEKNRYSKIGIGLLFVFTFGMGLMLEPLLSYALSLPNGGNLVALAALMTAGAFFTMAAIAKRTNINMSALNNFLFIGFVVLMVGVVANLFLKLTFLSLALCAGFVIFSSLVIVWQIKHIIDGGEDSYISAALTIFIAIYNIFTSILRILIAIAGDD